MDPLTRPLSPGENFWKLVSEGKNPRVFGEGRYDSGSGTRSESCRTFNVQSFVVPYYSVGKIDYVDTSTARLHADVVEHVCACMKRMRVDLSHLKQDAIRRASDIPRGDAAAVWRLYVESASKEAADVEVAMRRLRETRKDISDVYERYVRPWHAVHRAAYRSPRAKWLPSPEVFRSELQQHSVIAHDAYRQREADTQLVRAVRSSGITVASAKCVLTYTVQAARHCLEHVCATYFENAVEENARLLGGMITSRRTDATDALRAVTTAYAVTPTEALRNAAASDKIDAKWMHTWLEANSRFSAAHLAFVESDCRCKSSYLQQQGDVSDTADALIAELRRRRGGASEELLTFVRECDRHNVTFSGTPTTFVLPHVERRPSEMIIECIGHALGRCSRGVPNEIVTVSFRSGRVIVGPEFSVSVLPSVQVRSLALAPYVLRDSDPVHTADMKLRGLKGAWACFRKREAQQGTVYCEMSTRIEVPQSPDDAAAALYMAITRAGADDDTPMMMVSVRDARFAFVPVERMLVCASTQYTRPLTHVDDASLALASRALMTEIPSSEGARTTAHMAFRGFLVPLDARTGKKPVSSTMMVCARHDGSKHATVTRVAVTFDMSLIGM